MLPFHACRKHTQSGTQSRTADHNAPVVRDKPWFNGECKQLHNRHLYCLRMFNKAKTSVNLRRLQDAKKKYKIIGRFIKKGLT